MNRRILIVVAIVAVACGSGAVLSAEAPPVRTEAARLTVEQSVRSLWRANLQAPSGESDESGLDEAVRRLESIRVELGPVVEVETRPAEDPMPLPPIVGPIAATRPTSVATSRPVRVVVRPVTDLARVRPDRVDDPAGLADVLFLSGRLETAARFYDAVAASDVSAEQQAWALFQAANCRREADPDAAAKAFGRLETEHPDSLWSSVARTQKQLIEWRKTKNVSALLTEIGKLKPR